MLDFYDPSKEVKKFLIEDNSSIFKEFKPTDDFVTLISDIRKDLKVFHKQNQDISTKKIIPNEEKPLKDPKKQKDAKDTKDSSKKGSDIAMVAKKLIEKKSDKEKSDIKAKKHAKEKSSEIEKSDIKAKKHGKEKLKEIVEDQIISKHRKHSPKEDKESKINKKPKPDESDKKPRKKASKSDINDDDKPDIPKEYKKAGKLSKEDEEILAKINKGLLNQNQDKNSFFISMKESLLVKAEEYKNEEIRNTIQKASNYYDYRAVKGDGNCSYRCIIFLYIEQLLFRISKLKDLKKPFIERFYKNLLNCKFSVHCNRNREDYELKEKALLAENGDLLKRYFINKFNELVMHRIENPKEDKDEFSKILVNLLKDLPIFDLALISLIRSLILAFYKKKKADYQPFLEENKDYELFISEMDLEGESIVIKFASDMLRSKISIINIEKSLQRLEEYIPKEVEEEMKEMILYFRTGHYDCLYQKGEKRPIFGMDGKADIGKNENKEKKDNLKEDFEKRDSKVEKKIYCNKCKSEEGHMIKSKNCDHSICINCILEKGVVGKTIKCLVCNYDMMTNEEFQNTFS